MQTPGAACASIFRTTLRDRPLYFQLYSLTVALVVFIAPCIVIAYCYTALVRELSRAPTVTAHSVRKVSDTSSTTTTAVDDRIVRARSKTRKLTVAVLGAFLVASLPYNVMQLCDSFGLSSVFPPFLRGVFYIITTSSSAFNPWIYLLTTRWASVVYWCCCCWRRPLEQEQERWWEFWPAFFLEGAGGRGWVPRILMICGFFVKGTLGTWGPVVVTPLDTLYGLLRLRCNRGVASKGLRG